MSSFEENSSSLTTEMTEKEKKNEKEEVDEVPLTSDKLSEKYIECKEEDLIKYSDEEEEAFYKEAVVKFNVKPKSAREYLISKKIIQGKPAEIANFIYNQPKLSKRRIGEYIGNIDEFNQCVCDELFLKYEFGGKSLDAALRVLMMQFRLPGEAQQIDRILEKFASRYHEMNPGVFLNADTAFVLAFSIIMLNTDLHNQSITPDKKMTLEQFVRNNRGINQGKDISKEVLEKIYISVRDDEIRMDEADMYESEVVAFMAPTKSGWLSKKSESILGHWKRHWFVLNDGCLYYFINPSDEGPRCIIPLDNTRIGKSVASTDFVITSASGDYVKSSKVIEDGRMEQGKHTQFLLRCTNESDRDNWVQTLQQECLRFKPLHEIFLRRRDQAISSAPAERPLSIPEPIAEGWMRKRGAVNTGWKRRYFVMYPDFDGGGTTLFYYVSYQVAMRMKDLGMQTQQGYIRMRNIHEVSAPDEDETTMPYIRVVTDERVWNFAPDEPEQLDYWFDAFEFALKPYL